MHHSINTSIKEASMAKRNDKRQNKVVNGANMAELHRYSRSIDCAIDTAKKNVLSQAERYKNNTFASRNGFVAEEVHVGSFNIDSAIKRSGLKAISEKNGNHGDYRILKNGRTVAKGEFKHYSTAEQTENAMRGYSNRDLVGPKDQIETIKKVAKKKAMKNVTTRPKVAKEHRMVGRKATDAIRKDGVSSRPKTLKQTRRITKKADKGIVETKELLPDFNESLKSSVKSGAIEGAKNSLIFGGGMCAMSNFIDVINGNKSAKEAVIHTTKETAVNIVDGTVKNAVGSAAKTAAVHLAEKTASHTVKTFCRSAAPVIVAVSVVEIGKDVYKCVNGDIEGEELGRRAVKTTATAAGGWAGAEAGALAGAMVGGPVGAAVGGVVGGILGGLGVGCLFD